MVEDPLYLSAAPRCAICGQPIEDGKAETIAGIYGRGLRHSDYSICMTALRGEDPYA